MLIRRYLIKETLKTQLAVLLVLLLLFFSQRFIQILGMAVEGRIPGGLVFELLMLNMPSLMTYMLPVSLFVAILFAHGRLHAESEMVVMSATGISPQRISGIMMWLALATAALTLVNNLWLAPKANQKEMLVVERASADAGLATLMEGRFQKLPGNRGVVYVEEYSEGQKLGRVFAAYWPKNDSSEPFVLRADQGYLVEDEQGQWLQLDNGKRVGGEVGRQDFNVAEFERFRVFLKAPDQQQTIDGLPLDAIDSRMLWGSNERAMQLELHWRIATALTPLILTLMVVPLAFVNPRQGRFSRFLPAAMLYLSFFLLLSAMRSLINENSFPLWPGLWLVMLVGLLVAAALNLGKTRWWLSLRARRLKPLTHNEGQ